VWDITVTAQVCKKVFNLSALKTYCFTFLVVMLKLVKKVGTYNPNGSNTRNVKEGVGKHPHK